MQHSSINEMLHQICTLAIVGTLYCIFTDKGFGNNTNIIRSFMGWFMLTLLQRESNRIMSRVRVGVEWGFVQIRSKYPLLVKSEI